MSLRAALFQKSLNASITPIQFIPDVIYYIQTQHILANTSHFVSLEKDPTNILP